MPIEQALEEAKSKLAHSKHSWAKIGTHYKCLGCLTPCRQRSLHALTQDLCPQPLPVLAYELTSDTSRLAPDQPTQPAVTPTVGFSKEGKPVFGFGGRW